LNQQLQRQINDKKQDNQRLQAKNEDLTKVVTEVRGSNQQLQRQINEVRRWEQELQRQVNGQEKDYGRLQAKNEDLTKVVTEVREYNQKFALQREKDKSEHQRVVDKIRKEHQKTIDELEERISILQKKKKFTLGLRCDCEGTCMKWNHIL
jgi:chromosome segregation ATPase